MLSQVKYGEELLAKGDLGMKAGKGIFDWSNIDKDEWAKMRNKKNPSDDTGC